MQAGESLKLDIEFVTRITGALMAAMWLSLPESVQTWLVVMLLHLLCMMIEAKQRGELSWKAVGRFLRLRILFCGFIAFMIWRIPHLVSALAGGLAIYEFRGAYEFARAAGMPFVKVLADLTRPSSQDDNRDNRDRKSDKDPEA